GQARRQNFSGVPVFCGTPEHFSPTREMICRKNKSLGRLTEKSGGAYGTIFATFSCRQRQKCSVSCNSCEQRLSPASRSDPASVESKSIVAVTNVTGLFCNP